MSFNYPGVFGSSRRNMRGNVNPWSNMFGGGSNIGGGQMGGGFVPRGFMDFNNISPFGSNLMSQMDIFDPFNQIDRMMNRSLRWIDQPSRNRSIGQRTQRQRPRSIIQQQQQPFGKQQQQQTRSRSRSGGLGLNTAMPQKYRISVDCTGFDPNVIRPSVQNIQNQKHLVLTCKDRGGQSFKRSFTLPKNVKHEKLNTFLGPNNQFVCEFPFLENPTSLGLKLVPTIVGEGKDKNVVVETRIPQFIDPLSVNVCVKGHELIIRFEQKSAAPDSISRAYFYNRVTLPINCDLTKIHCVQKKRWLIIRAPIITALKGGFRTVPIHRKLRHRLLQKLQEVKQQQQQGITSMNVQQQQKPFEQKQQKQKTSTKIGGWEQVPQQKMHKTLSQQKLSSKSTFQQPQQQQGKVSQKGSISQQFGQQQQGKQTKKSGETTQRRIGSDMLHEVFGTSQPKQQQWTGGVGTQQKKTSNIKEQSIDVQKQQPGLKKKKNKSKSQLGGTDTAGIRTTNVDDKMKSGTNISGGGEKGSCSTCSPSGQSDVNMQVKSNISPTSSKSNLRSSPTKDVNQRSSPTRDVNMQQSSSQSGLNQ